MKHSLFLCVVLIAALGPAVEAFFLGPVAVGVGLGALAVAKGLILGSILGGSRTQERGGRSYTRYTRFNFWCSAALHSRINCGTAGQHRAGNCFFKS